MWEINWECAFFWMVVWWGEDICTVFVFGVVVSIQSTQSLCESGVRYGPFLSFFLFFFVFCLSISCTSPFICELKFV